MPPRLSIFITPRTADFGDYTRRVTRSYDRRKFELSLAPKQSFGLASLATDKNIVTPACAGAAHEK
jgi:hypothetical protein